MTRAADLTTDRGAQGSPSWASPPYAEAAGVQPPPEADQPPTTPSTQPRSKGTVARWIAGISVALIVALLAWWSFGTSPEGFNRRLVVEPSSEDWRGASPEEGIVRVIGEGATLTPEVEGREAEEWDLLVGLLGADRVTAKFATVRFYADPADLTEAAVANSATDPIRLDLMVNLARPVDPKDQAVTYVHEYAHALTLTPEQLDDLTGWCPWVSDDDCPISDSLSDAWQARFWDQYGSDVPSDEGAWKDEVVEFFEDYPEDFVNVYAASNVFEDFAETFALWVTGPETTADSLVAGKFAMLESVPEFAEVREDVRAHMDPSWLDSP